MIGIIISENGDNCGPPLSFSSILENFTALHHVV